MKKLIFALLLCVSASVSANGVYLGAVSQHFNMKNVTNQTHVLVIFEYERYLAGGFTNSFGGLTVLVAKDYKRHYKDFTYGAMLGAAHGYNCKRFGLCYKSVVPVLAPYVSYSKYRIQPTLAIFGGAAFLTVKVEY